MLRPLLLAAALLAPAAFAGDLVGRQGGDTLRLTDKPCAAEDVLKRVPVDRREALRAAVAVIGGQAYPGCWLQIERHAHILYEDGDSGLVPMSELREELDA